MRGFGPKIVAIHITFVAARIVMKAVRIIGHTYAHKSPPHFLFSNQNY